MFLHGPRASQSKTQIQVNPIKKDNYLTKLTEYALASHHKQKSTHEKVESFFLINDAYTVCTELPVFLNPKETTIFNIDTPLTGHIDIIQIKNDTLHIMDYKPNLRHPRHYAGQLMAYKEAIHHRTRISKEKIITAVFNHHSYYEYK